MASGADIRVAVAEGVRRLTAPNASAWTAAGTNTYVLEGAEALVVDPGPDLDPHLAAILGALGGRRLGAILVTHSHLDHSGLAPRLGRATGAPVLAWGDSGVGRRAAEGDLGGGGGVDAGFRPDRTVVDGERLEPWGLRVIHTPGHMGNHVCLDRGDVLLTGDHAMGWASTVVSPPEGDMGDYVASLERLMALGARRLLPGHGEPVEDGAERLRRLGDHRREREAEVLRELAGGPDTAAAITERIYAGLPAAMRRAAGRNVLAHLVELDRRGWVAADRPLREGSPFRLVPRGLDSPGGPR